LALFNASLCTMHQVPNFNIVLVEPQIPNNTGNIGRLCVGTNSKLHLIQPLGFEITDKRVKRAGLDYWPELDLLVHKSFDSWLSAVESDERVFFFSAKGGKSLYEHEMEQGDWLVFGKEENGLGEAISKRFEEQLLRIPFPGKIRSFNLANAVAMVLGEGIRQLAL